MIQRIEGLVKESCQPVNLTILRREYGYAGIEAIGVDASGKLFMGEFDRLSIPPSTRIIENEPVKNALSAPIKVYFDPSDICPLFCNFCLAGVATSKERKRKLPSLSRDQTMYINRQLINMGVLQVKLGGGEPFIYRYFWESIEQLGSAGIALSASTSGITLNNPRLLPKDMIELLIRNAVKISISIDGEPHFHNRIRGQENLFEMALQGRQRLLEHGYYPEKIEFRATIFNDPESIGQLEFLNQLSQDLQTIIRIRSAKPLGSAKDNGLAIIYPDHDFWVFYESIRRLAEQNPLLNLDEVFAYDKKPELLTALDCGAGTRNASLDAYGHFLPCNFLGAYFLYHEIFNEGKSLLELWRNGQAFRDVRKYLETENRTNPCSACGYVHSCQGGCPSVRLQAQTKTDPRCYLKSLD